MPDYEKLRELIQNNPKLFSPTNMSSERDFALKLISLLGGLGVIETPDKTEEQPEETEEVEHDGG